VEAGVEDTAEVWAALDVDGAVVVVLDVGAAEIIGDADDVGIAEVTSAVADVVVLDN
jgi:hypothetical protein